MEEAEGEGVSSTEPLNFIIYDTISAPPNPYEPRYSISSSSSSHDDPNISLVNDNVLTGFMLDQHCAMKLAHDNDQCHVQSPSPPWRATVDEGGGAGGRKKRKRRARACKNKEEAEVQRMTHINVERNRRKLMNDHLSVLRSLMPDSYVQRGDQASIVGGAIEFVKKLEHLLQSLEAKKLQLSIQHQHQQQGSNEEDNTNTNTNTNIDDHDDDDMEAPFAEFFTYPQYTWSQVRNKYATCNATARGVADVEVTLIETHASLRILFRRCLLTRQLSHIVAAFHALRLPILHLTLTSAHPFVLYSINAKVEEGCHVTCVDDIAAAVHDMLRLIEHEAAADAALC